MAKEISHTLHDGAPLTAATHPDPEALAEAADAQPGDTIVGRTVTINRPRGELYAFWRNFENLSRFMESVQSVRTGDQHRSHWVVSAPAGRTVEWDSEVIDEIPNERISWATVEATSVRNSGTVELRDWPTKRGTLVSMVFAYDPPDVKPM